MKHNTTTRGAPCFFALLIIVCAALPGKLSAQTYTFSPANTISDCTGCAGAIILPETNGMGTTITTIGTFAFFNNPALTSVTFPSGLTTIGDGAFSLASGLTTVTFPAGLTSIGGGAFVDSGLTSVTLPAGLMSIGAAAFQNANLASVTVPAAVTTIDDFAFFGNPALSSVLFEGDRPAIAAMSFGGNAALATVNYYEGSAGWPGADINNGTIDITPAALALAATPVPTLSVWALLLLSGLTVLVGGRASRRTVSKD